MPRWLLFLRFYESAISQVEWKKAKQRRRRGGGRKASKKVNHQNAHRGVGRKRGEEGRKNRGHENCQDGRKFPWVRLDWGTGEPSLALL